MGGFQFSGPVSDETFLEAAREHEQSKTQAVRVADKLVETAHPDRHLTMLQNGMRKKRNSSKLEN